MKKFFVILTHISLTLCIEDSTKIMSYNEELYPAPDPPPTHFYYFAYGSNLWKTRVQINARSANLYSIALLKGYRLDFNITSTMWNGAVATIAPDPDAAVWGAVWIVHLKEQKNLDKQEAIGSMYYSTNVMVVTPRREVITARTYIQYVDPPKVAPQDLPEDRKPSLTYLKVIIYGAVELGLPPTYIDRLKTFAHNGREASNLLRNQLGYPFVGRKDNMDPYGGYF